MISVYLLLIGVLTSYVLGLLDGLLKGKARVLFFAVLLLVMLVLLTSVVAQGDFIDIFTAGLTGWQIGTLWFLLFCGYATGAYTAHAWKKERKRQDGELR